MSRPCRRPFTHLSFGPGDKIGKGLMALLTALYGEQRLFGLDIEGIEGKPKQRIVSHCRS
jgi:hypothetical protein